MRLIDADELKKCAIPCEIHNGTLTDLCIPLYQIDNAPTVNDCPNCEYKLQFDYISSSSSYKELQALRKFKTEHERPQGEWKETGYETGALGITYRQTQCSNCGWEHALPMWWNFCPNCGADMRGEDNNETS